ncbi:uncharacterized protein [Ptychodera flava]|uniref:uncharacterized protein n=1 Tax=Ptychodera flava TaxID=63121 RepID=UPI00396A6BFF
METDEKEAKQLLKLASPVRKHAFARMVSWEFSQPSQPCKNRRKKQRVLSVTTDDVNSDEDDVNSDEDCVARDTGDGAESDEYYTADEEVSSVSGEELEMEEEEVSLEGLTLSDVPLPKSERHGGRSKSQKRRRKRIYRQNQLDFFAPFANDEGDMIEAVQAEDLKPVKNVPTLMEICLKACSQGNSGPLPILKQHKDELKHRRALHSQQLKWLHRILLINEKGFDPERVTFEKVGRCVFQEGYERKDLDDFFSRHMQFDALKSLMLKHSCNDLSANEKIAVLAHVIDLMLPSTFRCKRSPSVTEDEDDILRKARQTAVIKVKIALKARYPRFVEHLFDISLAYVWWARGHLGQASELLFQAADQVKTKTTPAHKDSTERRSNHLHLQKAMYMNDAGLMYAVFGDPIAAAKCYRQAAEVSCTGFQSGVQDDVVLQSMILIAAAWDQGLMNKKSSVNSASAWNAVMASPADCPLEAVYAAVEAFLCFHAGYSTDSSNLSQEEENKAWLIEAKEKLEKLMKTFPEASVLKLYYSFVLAMLGNGYDSIQALRLFTSSCDPASYPQGFPARQVRQATKASVFQPLVDIAKETHRPVPVMPLLWRRQLVHPIISKTSHSLLADKQSVPLNLHITDEGYLTGDMYLNLPPMRGVLLDPYTGSVCIPHTPSVSQPWNSLPDFTIRCYEDHLPIPVQIYKDPSRHLTVDMVNVVHYENNHWSNQGIYLHWRDPNRNYKLNLRNVVKKVMKEEILKHAKSEVVAQDKSKKGLTSSDYEEGAKKLEEHYQRGWIFHYSHIFGYGRKQCSCGVKKTKRKRYTYPVSMFNICIKKLVRFGPASVLFMLNTVKTDTMTADTLVFLDMTSLETFVNPVVHYVGAGSDRFFQVETVPATDNSIEPQHQYVNVIGITRIDEKGGCLR